MYKQYSVVLEIQIQEPSSQERLSLLQQVLTRSSRLVVVFIVARIWVALSIHGITGQSDISIKQNTATNSTVSEDERDHKKK